MNKNILAFKKAQEFTAATKEQMEKHPRLYLELGYRILELEAEYNLKKLKNVTK